MSQNNRKSVFENQNSKLDELNKCEEWLKNCNINNEDTDTDEENSTNCSTSSILSEFDDNEFFSVVPDNNICCDKFVSNNNKNNNTISSNSLCTGINLNSLIQKEGSNFENIRIYNSKRVHIGNITHIAGPVYINQFSPDENNKKISNTRKNKILPVFVKDNKKIWIVPRQDWLAQPPEEPPEYLETPNKFVVILHTASEELFTTAENIYSIRIIQTFHIEGRKWNDIAYNFLIGSDGSAYEGRGWGIRGAFAHKYNQFSLGIAFIGCFNKNLPPPTALEKAKQLIRYGVQIGAVAEDYKLLCHSQCSATRSPGEFLIKEIQQWEHYDPSISVNNPSFLINQSSDL